MSTEEQVSAPTESATELHKLYLGNLDYSTTKTDLQELFKDYEVKSILLPQRPFRLKNGKVTYRPKGFGFVTFEDTEQDLAGAILKLNDFEFKGRPIQVSYSNVKSVKPAEEKKTEEDSPEQVNEGVKDEKKKKPTKKAPKERLPFDQGIKSIDTLHMKNLDFSVTSTDIGDFFTSQGETVTWISVPFRGIPKKVAKKMEEEGKEIVKRNKGYAFVKLSLEDGSTLEEKVAKFTGQSLKDREVILSVAVDVRPKVEATDAPKASEAPEADAATETETTSEPAPVSN